MPEAQTHLAAHCCFKCKSLSHGQLVTFSHTFSNISSSASAHSELTQHLFQKASSSYSLQIFYGLLIPLDLPSHSHTSSVNTSSSSLGFLRFLTLAFPLWEGPWDCHNCRRRLTTISPLPDWPDRFAISEALQPTQTVKVPTNCQYLTICSVSPPHSILFQIYQNKLESFKFRK